MLGDDDEGNYSCRSNGFVSDAVTLRVVSEELEEGKWFVKSNLFCMITWWFLSQTFLRSSFCKRFSCCGISQFLTFHNSRGDHKVYKLWILSKFLSMAMTSESSEKTLRTLNFDKTSFHVRLTKQLLLLLLLEKLLSSFIMLASHSKTFSFS